MNDLDFLEIIIKEEEIRVNNLKVKNLNKQIRVNKIYFLFLIKNLKADII